MDGVEDAKITRVENWLAENVRVITQANELTLSDFTYNCKSYIGQFSISVDGEALEGRWHFFLETSDGWPSVTPPMFTSPLGVPASYRAIELTDEIDAALRAKMREIFPRIAPLGRNRKTGVEITMGISTVADRIIDHEGYRNTVSQIENGSLRVTINLD